MCGFNKDNFVEMEFGEGKGESTLASPLEKHISVTLDMRSGTLSGWDSLWQQIDREEKERKRIEEEMGTAGKMIARRAGSMITDSKYLDPL